MCFIFFCLSKLIFYDPDYRFVATVKYFTFLNVAFFPSTTNNNRKKNKCETQTNHKIEYWWWLRWFCCFALEVLRSTEETVNHIDGAWLVRVSNHLLKWLKEIEMWHYDNLPTTLSLDWIVNNKLQNLFKTTISAMNQVRIQCALNCIVCASKASVENRFVITDIENWRRLPVGFFSNKTAILQEQYLQSTRQVSAIYFTDRMISHTITHNTNKHFCTEVLGHGRAIVIFSLNEQKHLLFWNLQSHFITARME